MQGNGFKIFTVIFFLALSFWYLFPSVRGLYYNRKINNLPQEEQEAFRQDNFTLLRNIQENALKLGLDLQGGMHVTLEVGLTELLDQLADERRDATFNEVLSAASRRANTEDVGLIDAFLQEFEKRDPNASLSRYFRSEDIPMMFCSASSKSWPAICNRAKAWPANLQWLSSGSQNDRP